MQAERDMCLGGCGLNGQWRSDRPSSDLWRRVRSPVSSNSHRCACTNRWPRYGRGSPSPSRTLEMDQSARRAPTHPQGAPGVARARALGCRGTRGRAAGRGAWEGRWEGRSRGTGDAREGRGGGVRRQEGPFNATAPAHAKRVRVGPTASAVRPPLHVELADELERLD